MLLPLLRFIQWGGVLVSPVNSALAKTIQNDQGFSGSIKFIIVKDDNKQQIDNRGFLKKFANFYNRDFVCGLNDDQYHALSLIHETALSSVHVNGEDVLVVTVEKEHNLKKQDLEKIAQNSGSKPHCKVLKHNQLFYLLFIAHIS